VYATKEYVDRVERRLYGRETLIKEDLGAIGDTVVELLEGQQRLETRVGALDSKADTLTTRVDALDGNLRAVMRHLGVPEVDDQREP
jgi:chaperonin cofactor prefoldin